MRNTIRRIERLEQAYYLGAAEVPPMEITNVFIAPDGEVVDSFVITIPPPGYTPWPRNAKLPGSNRTTLNRDRA